MPHPLIPMMSGLLVHTLNLPSRRMEIMDNVDILLRRLASFYTRYAKEVVLQKKGYSRKRDTHCSVPGDGNSVTSE